MTRLTGEGSAHIASCSMAKCSAYDAEPENESSLSTLSERAGESHPSRDIRAAEAPFTDEDLTLLPDPPERPLPGECCGSGCQPCVLDVYQDQLEEWNTLKDMSPGDRAIWRLEKRRKQRKGVAASESGPPALSHSDYHSFSVVAVEQLTRDIFLFTFELESGQRLGLRMGQHILLRVSDEHGKSLVRQYTPVSPLDCQGSFQVAIKLYPKGRMSHYVREWRIGSTALWRGPFGNLPYTPNKYSHVGLLACGTGIAPMIQVIRAIVENEGEDTFVRLLYASRTEHDIILKTVLDGWTCYWNFTVLYALSRATEVGVASGEGSIRYGDRVHLGRINSELVGREIPPPGSGRGFMMVCGTESFISDMLSYLELLGYSRDTIFVF